MSRSKIIIAAAVVLLIAGAGWYFASPAYSMSQLRDAAVEGDEAALEEQIDFPKVRESLKKQMRALLAAAIAKPENQENGFAQMGAMLGMAMIDPMIEGFVTPESMAAMIKQGKMQRAQAPAEAPAEEPQDELADWTIERDGLSRFTATPEVPTGEAAPTMVFERDGLGWDLVGIVLPDEAMPDGGG